MKLELKLISLIFSLGVFSLPVQSQVCPGYQCPNGGPCVNPGDQCPDRIVKFQGKAEYIYILPAGTSYYCENGQTPKSPAAGTDGPSYFVCSLETSSRYAKLRTSTPFVPQTDTTYSLGDNTAVQCATGEPPIQKGNLWSCPAKASK